MKALGLTDGLILEGYRDASLQIWSASDGKIRPIGERQGLDGLIETIDAVLTAFEAEGPPESEGVAWADRLQIALDIAGLVPIGYHE